MQLLLTQHLLARAALKFWRRSDFHQTSHSNGQVRVKTKLQIRSSLLQIERHGQSGLVQVWIWLTQDLFAVVAPFYTKRSEFHQISGVRS